MKDEVVDSPYSIENWLNECSDAELGKNLEYGSAMLRENLEYVSIMLIRRLFEAGDRSWTRNEAMFMTMWTEYPRCHSGSVKDYCPDVKNGSKIHKEFPDLHRMTKWVENMLELQDMKVVAPDGYYDD